MVEWLVSMSLEEVNEVVYLGSVFSSMFRRMKWMSDTERCIASDNRVPKQRSDYCSEAWSVIKNSAILKVYLRVYIYVVKSTYMWGV